MVDGRTRRFGDTLCDCDWIDIDGFLGSLTLENPRQLPQARRAFFAVLVGGFSFFPFGFLNIRFFRNYQKKIRTKQRTKSMLRENKKSIRVHLFFSCRLCKVLWNPADTQSMNGLVNPCQ